MHSVPFIVIVILNWNNAPDTEECLDSIDKLEYDNFDVIVVDNGSTDKSVEKIRKKHPSATLINLETNVGYSAGNNVGINHALEKGAEYVLILNNDTLVDSNMLSELVQVAQTNSQIGMVGPKMYCIDPPDTLFAAGSTVLWNTGDTLHHGIFQPESKVPLKDSPVEVDFIAGCGVLVSRQLIETIGLLDHQYYLNYEDVEWGIRANRSGFKVVFAPNAVLWHKISATLKRHSPTNTYYLTRNSLRFFWENGPTHKRWMTILIILLRNLRSCTAWTIKKKYRKGIYKKKRNVILYAIRDFLFKNYGEMGPDVARLCKDKS